MIHFVANFLGAFVGAFGGIVACRAVGAWTVRRAFNRMKAAATTPRDLQCPIAVKIAGGPHTMRCVLPVHGDDVEHDWPAGYSTADTVPKRP